MLLTFIIPYYNGIKYIDECITSIYQQNIPISDFEVLVIDDLSSDMCSIEVLFDLKKKYQNICIKHNDKNLRCGVCRNIGVQNAKGKYVWFVDQDDYIKPNCLADILHSCETGNLDILYFDYSNVSDDLSLNRKLNLVTNNTPIMTGLEYIHSICHGDFWHGEYDTNVWHAVYKRDFLIKNNIFSPPVSYCEDLIVAQHAIIAANRFQAVSNDYYCYRYNPSSVFNTQVGKKGRLIFDASIYAGTILIKLASLIDPIKHFKEYITVFDGGKYRLNSFTKQIFKIPTKEREIFFEYVLNNPTLLNEYNIHLNRLNKWILNHANLCKRIPRIIYMLIVAIALFKVKRNK